MPKLQPTSHRDEKLAGENTVMRDSTAGYVEKAEELISRFEGVDFEALHQPVSHLFPRPPARILDVGAGSGRDAGAFAQIGHQVVAVEPVDAFRDAGYRLHPHPDIRWVNDRLPALKRVKGQYDLILASAVWMHLDEKDRRAAMRRVGPHLAPDSIFILSLRHGPVPPERRMYDVSSAETIFLAAKNNLKVVLRLEEQPSVHGTPGVTWTRLAFKRLAE